MSKKRRGKKKGGAILHPDTKASVLAVGAIGASLVFLLSAFEKAGPAGNFIFSILDKSLGWGYFLIPFLLALVGFNTILNIKRAVVAPILIGAGFFVVSGLGIIDIISPGNGGLLGGAFGSLEKLFGRTASLIVHFTVLIGSVLAILNVPLSLSFKLPRFKTGEKPSEEPKIIVPEAAPIPETYEEEKKEERGDAEGAQTEEKHDDKHSRQESFGFALRSGKYVLPPLKLLKTFSEKPTVGDLRANANIIKRTLESFGIAVEMGEITIGPKVTRYTLKPAEGVKLSRIIALGQDLSLALAAHPIRIEAPIPGRSLVGIEIPNKIGSIVRLGSLLGYQDFQKGAHLVFPLGRDVSGEPVFGNLAKMPHLLIAGSTGSGKSVTIHSFILSLLYKNSPETLRFILIDPKRVELSVYENIPHLITPVITEGKRAIAALRFAIQEMENRYETLLGAGKRDIGSYNAGRKENHMPYLVIVIDELADLMAAYGREVEGSIVRLAQMARATGIHLVVSTQRPSVEVITGLIKANISSRVALQVASQIDSRTILDSAGAEKLLGGGDMLFISSDITKPKRVQGSFITDEEISGVVGFIRDHNSGAPENGLSEALEESTESANGDIDAFMENGDDDELYGEALRVVREAKKASASLLQRRLKVGYARAARLLDIMEEREIIGPADGAKPREIYISGAEEDIV